MNYLPNDITTSAPAMPSNRYVLPSFEERTPYGYKRQDPYAKLFEDRIIFLGANDGGCHRRRGRHAGRLGGADGQRHVAGHSSSSSLRDFAASLRTVRAEAHAKSFVATTLPIVASPPLPARRPFARG